MKIRDCATLKCLRTSLVALGIGMLLSACGGSDNQMDDIDQMMVSDPMMDDDKMAGDDPMMDNDKMAGDDPMMDNDKMAGDDQMTQLGEWGTIPGHLIVGDANNLLRAHYDSIGGQVVAGNPVQPEGMETATWTGMWSGEIEVDPTFRPNLPLIGATGREFYGMTGGAVVTVHFGGTGVEADLTYQDLGLEVLGLSSFTSERVPVTDGMFQPTSTTRALQAEFGTQPILVTGFFYGEGAFGGANAEGVIGYMGGGISYLGSGIGVEGPEPLGTFRSVFYGNKDAD